MKSQSPIMRASTLLTTGALAVLLLIACTGNEKADLNPTMIGDVADAPPTLADLVSPPSASNAGSETATGDEASASSPGSDAEEVIEETVADVPTEASALSLPPGDIARGESLAAVCMGCHTVNGSPGVGPTWLGLYGHEVALSDGTTVTADDAYIAQSILDPTSQVVEGYSPSMPPFTFSDQELADIIAYITSLEG